MPEGRKLTSEQEDEIVRLYLSGLSQRDTGLATGVSKTGVESALKRRGVVMRPRTPPPREEKPPKKRKRSFDQHAEAQTVEGAAAADPRGLGRLHR